MKKRIRCWLAAALAVAATTAALAQNGGCGSLASSYGPYDYRRERHDKLRIVEQNHFTPEVAALLRGKSGPLGADLDFVLRASPNHHRALEALVRLRERPELLQRSGLPRTVECYFDRALRFQPNDTTVRLFYVTLLIQQNRRDEALRELERARGYAGDNPFTHHNIGLLYLDAGAPAQALAQAHRALELGFVRDDLRARLAAGGHWRDPAPSVPRQAAEPASAPASEAAR